MKLIKSIKMKLFKRKKEYQYETIWQRKEYQNDTQEYQNDTLKSIKMILHSIKMTLRTKITLRRT